MQIKFFLFAVLINVLFAKHISQEESRIICADTTNGFATFKSLFNKQYPDSQQEQDAFTAFQQCCRTILTVTSNSNTYTVALHPKCDVILNTITSGPLYFPSGSNNRAPPEPATNNTSTNVIVGAVQRLVGSGCPSNYKDKTTTPKDQGSCGACWSFATTAAYETRWNMVNGQKLDLSEEYVLECTASYDPSSLPASTCAGGVIDYALEMIVNTGMPTEATYPYAAYSFGTGSSTPSTIGSCSSNSGFKKLVFPVNKTNAIWNRYDNITSSQVQTLLNDGTLVVGIYAEANLFAYSSGVFVCSVSNTAAYSQINHAVELVGMDCSGNYIIKNSWGTGWGQGGYATVSPSNDCGIAGYVYQILYGQNIQGFFLGLFVLLVFQLVQ